MTQVIAIEQAKPGMMIVRVTVQNGPVRIKKSGLITSPAMIQGLIEMGVQEIEFDPEQTVEICADETASTAEPTPTQSLLRGQYDTRAQKADSAISDQFNRSLFLPTVNGLTGQWQRSAKPLFIGMLLAVGGVATGYVLATLPAVINELVETPVIAPQKLAVVSVQQPKNEVSLASGLPGSTGSVSQTIVPSAAGNPAADDRIAHERPDVTLPQGAEVVQPDNTEPAAAEENTVTVSPELMARFNKVLTDLEKEEERGEEPAANNTVVTVHDDIQRVDQLPARLLTRLPAMDFSAHMYASVPRDRWVRVNGEDKGEGDWIADRVQIVNIEAQRVILRFEGEVFSMTALTDW